MNRKYLITLVFLLWTGFVNAENFSALAPKGITVNNVSENADGYKVTGISKDNSTISAFMNSIKNSGTGTPVLEMVVLNPNGAGKYFEMMVLKEGKTKPVQSSNNKENLLDKKYNVRVIIKEEYFEIDGNRYFNQTAIKNAYINKKGMKIVVCKEENVTDAVLHELLTTFSQLNTLRMDVLPGNDCN